MALFEPIFEALNGARVRYVVVGGVAVVLHGHARLTADLDIAIDLEREAALRAIGALSGLGLQPRAPVPAEDFADEELRAAWKQERGMRVFSMVDPNDPMRAVDVFVDEPLPFEELHERATVVDVSGVPVRVASIPDLIALKRIAGRPQDHADIEALEDIDRANGGHT